MTKPNHIQLSAQIKDFELREIFIYALGEAGFSTFEEHENEIRAYIETAQWDEQHTNEILAMYLDGEKIPYEIEEIEAKNWNEEWEKNYPNVYIDDFCQILPSFRQALEGFEYTLFIDPKMSFGTGHHGTTQSVIRLMRGCDLAGRKVLDMGCGTSVLGILADKMGAEAVLCIDIDPWCVENSMENIALNHAGHTEVMLGGAGEIPDGAFFDLLIANINRNILLADGSQYVRHLKPGSLLILSGFYEEDVLAIESHFEQFGMNRTDKQGMNNWVALLFEKKN